MNQLSRPREKRIVVIGCAHDEVDKTHKSVEIEAIRRQTVRAVIIGKLVVSFEPQSVRDVVNGAERATFCPRA